MNSHKREALSKYIPDNHHVAPPHYQTHHLQPLPLSTKLPSPRSNTQQNYELTFKKDPQQNYFLANEAIEPKKNLFNQMDHSLLKVLHEPLSQFYKMPMQELANLPFVDLMSLQLSEGQKQKLSLVGEILQMKRMRMKIGSCWINLVCLKSKQRISNEQKHKIYLLQLLWKQLNKKLFIEALKLNLSQRRYLASHENQQSLGMNQELRMKSENGLGQESYYLQERGQQRSSLWNKGLQLVDQKSAINEQQLIIFHQLLNLILKKVLFLSFNKINRYASQTNQYKVTKNTTQYIKPTANNGNNIILIPSDRKQPYFQEQREDMYSEQRDHDSQFGSQNYERQEQSKLNELYEYIEHLYEECATTNHLLNKYFIKWKIYILERIANNLEQQQSEQQHQHQHQHPSQQQEPEQQDEEEYFPIQSKENINNPKLQRQQQELDNFKRQRQLSQSKLSSISQQEVTLKVEKRSLKQYLRLNRQRETFSLLKGFNEKRKIRGICQYLYGSMLKKRAFVGWFESIEGQRRMKQMDEYYEETANDQDQEDTYTPEIFHKTNLLYKYFNQLKRNLRQQKLHKQLSYITLKLSYIKIKNFAFGLKRYDDLIRKRRMNKEKQTVFKCFKMWKQAYESQNTYNSSVKIFIHKRQIDTIRDCFMLMKIHFKRNRIRQLKATNEYYMRLKGKMFNELKQIHQDNQIIRHQQLALVGMLYAKRGETFISRLKEYYLNYIQFQRFTIKEEKLKRTLLKLHALQAIKNWRKRHLKNYAYKTIQDKLIQIKGRQKKRQIFKLWFEKMLRRENSEIASNKSQTHKEWLVKYYGKLCSVYEQ